MQARFILLAALVLSLPFHCSAQSQGQEQAIRRFFADADIAWNHHKARELTNPQNTAADADFVNVYGGWTKGLENFATVMGTLQAGPFHNVTRQTTVEKIRFVRPDVAVVITWIVIRTVHRLKPVAPSY